MGVFLGTYIQCTSPINVVVDGPTVIDPGDAPIVRIVTAIGSTPAVHAIKGGVQGRVLRLENVATSPAGNVDLVRDENATVGGSTERLRTPAATCDLFTYGVVTLIYANNAWRVIRVTT